MENKDREKDIIRAVNENKNILLHGCGGAGKTYMLKEIARHMIARNKNVCCTATTGIAAINLSLKEYGISGSTLHSWSGVGLGNGSDSFLVSMVLKNVNAVKRWRNTDLLIVDEISMLGGSFIDKLDYVGRSIRRCADKPFGGIQVIFSGDFLQLPPVNDKWAFTSFAWREFEFTSFILEQPKRYPNVQWFEMLLRIRKGQHTLEDVKFLHTRVTAYQEYKKSIESNKDVVIVKPTILYSKKIDVEAENEKEINKLPGKFKEFVATDLFTAITSHAKYEYYIKPLDETIPKVLCFKVGAQVMLKANLDPAMGLVNGSRGVITELHEDSVGVKWVNGNTDTISPHVWEQEDKDGKMKRSQIPLILAWCITIHKSQGATLDFAVGNLGPSVFCDGQAYVALSRVRSPEGLLLTEFYPLSIKTNKEALEYVDKLGCLPEIPSDPNFLRKFEKEEKVEKRHFKIKEDPHALPSRRILKPNLTKIESFSYKDCVLNFCS